MNQSRIWMICMTLLLSIVLSACQTQVSELPVSTAEERRENPAPKAKPSADAAKKTGKTESGKKKPKEKVKELEISSPSSTESTEAGDKKAAVDRKREDEPSAAKPKHKPVPEYNVTAPYNADKPTLMGLSIHEAKSAVSQKFGNPSGQYVMEDDTDPIVVYEYPGFSVGFSTSDIIQFVEVSSGDVNPGLNGLRLGQTVNDAIAAIGQPNINTEYVLSYKSGGVILKLDIDPNTQIIQSIKLFADI
jgi:hypothetical protein